jgi:hypothetical protein
MFSSDKDVASQQPVDCLGITFPSDEARRQYFLAKLREKLKDPAFRKIDGFPIGEDDDILAQSDPPYYTACPNPFAPDFLKHYGTPWAESGPVAEVYHREPFSADVSEGRNDDLYTAHTYHTKVPPIAIAKYVLHYTSPGEVVLDAFCGSGMTGVGCAMCTDHSLAKSVSATPGPRYAILCDLSPAATFIASVYANPPDPDTFAEASRGLIDRTDQQIGHLWQYTDDSGKLCQVEYQIWTELFTCPHCQKPVESSRVVEATEDIGTAKEFPCPHCEGLVSKAPSKDSNSSKLQRTLQQRFDRALGKVMPFLPRVPLFAQVRLNNERVKVATPTSQRQWLLGLELNSPDWFPTLELIRGERFTVKDCCATYGITHMHHFYLPRQLRTYSCLWRSAGEEADFRTRNALRFFVQSNGLGMTVMNRYGPTHYSQVNKYFSGTLYIPSMIAESSHRYTYESKRKRLVSAFGKLRAFKERRTLITTQSSTSLRTMPDNSIDYIFVDPPFGRNLQYSELNQIWEAWLKITTQRDTEAVMDSSQKREVSGYTRLMRTAFSEMNRVLKPGRWITVVFHNSSNAVWQAIQEALMGGKFVVADVRTLDRQRETYKQSRQGLVKQDLVISAYKPIVDIEVIGDLASGTTESVWAFVRSHMRQLPVFVGREGRVEIIAERQDYLLFDRMVAFFVERNHAVPMSAGEFFSTLRERFSERDGMFFLPDQAAEYEVKRLEAGELEQLELFVSDEKSAIQWLRKQLSDRPIRYQELQPLYMKEAQRVWEKHEQPLELQTILDQNFLHDEQGQWRIPDAKSEADLEHVRNKALLKEFQQYMDAKGKLKVVRTEALRAGFKECWQKQDYRIIVEMAKRVPETVVQEDQALLMYFDNALMRTGE